MKGLKRKFILCAIVVFSLIVLAGNSWSETIGLPHAGFGGFIQTFLDNGVNDNLIFLFSNVDSVVYSDGTLGTTDSILGSTVTITGAKRDPSATPGTTFTPATISISNGTTTYFLATLINIQFVLVDGLWRLNPGLDINSPPTMNLTNIILNAGPIPSNYILDLQTALGSQTIAGMTMTLNVFFGDITGDSFAQILEGLIDGVPAAAPNSPPVADAGATTTNITCAATSCEITLDGSQSTDPDSTPGTNDDIVSFEWFENAVLIATGETTPVTLSLGMHDITLRVTDSAGATSEITITVVIDPAELSFIDIDEAYVKKDGKIKVSGKIALPAGVSHFNVNSVGRGIIGISTLGNVIDELVDFTVHSNNNKWKYDANPAFGIEKFKIDWDGAKFSYRDDLHNMFMKTLHIGVNETELKIQSCAPATVDILQGATIIATISIDEFGGVTATPATIKVDADDDGDSDDSDSDGGHPSVDDSNCTARVRLPFALTPDMVINITYATDIVSVPVANHYTAAVGKFKLHGKFDATGIVFSSLVPTLELTVALGDEGFSGTLVIDQNTWTKVKPDVYWKYKSN